MSTIVSSRPNVGRRVILPALLMAAIGMGDAFAAQEPRAQIVPPPALTLESLDTWRDLIVPDVRDERWREIPWRTSLWQGLLDAQMEGKPLLIWVMNGHPMGCT